MDHRTTFVGLDAHKKSIVACALFGDGQEPRRWELPNRPRPVQRMVHRLMEETEGHVQFCYEAGPCGYALQRQIRKQGAECNLVAPSLIPRKPGDRVKTDRRDAYKLAEYDKGGLLTYVHPPDPAQEAVRDLCRCREVTMQDAQRCRHRITKLLLRRGLDFEAGKRPWTKKHRQWLHAVSFEEEADQLMFCSYLLALEQTEERQWGLEQHLERVASSEPYREVVAWLCCLRGIATLSALTLAVELHDFWRFPSPAQLASFVGLVPGEYSSGGTRRQGAITKAGNAHVRRILVEAAQHYRHVPGMSRGMRERRAGQPPWVVALADRAQSRLHRRYARLCAAGKPHNIAVVAVARELLGFIWQIMYTHAAIIPEREV
jgi:transposase